MKSVAIVIAMCGCNQVFDLDSTRFVEPPREFFDAPIDAPFACPADSSTPRFSPLLRQVIAQDCKDYITSTEAQRAMALCVDLDTYELRAAEGPIDGVLTPVPGLDDASFALQFLRLAPEGNELIAVYYATSRYEFRTYRRQSDATWTRAADFGTTTAYLDISGPTRGPNRHVMQTGFDQKLHEFVQDAGGQWTEVTSYTASELGVTYPAAPKLSSDGLRLMMTTTPPTSTIVRVMYSSRPTIQDRFGIAQPLEGVPKTLDAHMNDDCSRVYFSGLESVFFVQRL